MKTFRKGKAIIKLQKIIMKKVLKVMTLFVTMALTACGGAGTNSESAAPADSTSAATSTSAKPSTSKHTHTFDETKWVSNETQHWHPATCEHTDAKGSAAAHTFVLDESKTQEPATCDKAGKKYEKCSVCGYEKVTDLPKSAHDWQTQGKSADVAGAAKTEQFKCSFGDHYALRWSALDMDEAASIAACGLEAKDTTVFAEVNTSGSHADSIRLRKAENDGGEKEAFGTHVIYKVNVAADAQNVDLSFQIDPKSGYDVPVFDYVSGDQQQGYVKQADGTLKLTTKRYGLRVNGNEVELGQDLHGEVNGGSKLWFNWNVKMNLTAGINTIDVYCLGGYRAYIYNFQLDGLTAAQLPAKAAA